MLPRVVFDLLPHVDGIIFSLRVREQSVGPPGLRPVSAAPDPFFSGRKPRLFRCLVPPDAAEPLDGFRLAWMSRDIGD